MYHKRRLPLQSPLVGWSIIAYYLFAFASGGCIRPFVNLYLAEIGLNAAQIGMLQGWTALAMVLSTPLVGFLADRSQRHRFFLGIVVFIKSLFSPLTLLSNAFPWLVITFSLRNIPASISDALMNGLTLTLLRENHRSDIGTVRLWGSASYALMSMLAGFLARDRSIGILFPLAGLLGFLALVFTRAFPPNIRVANQPAHPNTLTRRPSSPMLLLFVIIFLFSFSRDGLATFGFVYLSVSLNAGNELIGLFGAIIGLAPIPGLYLADWCVRRWGQITTLLISFVLFLFALWGYALIPSAILALPVVLLEGIGLSIFLVSLAVILIDFSLPQYAATAMILAQVTIPGLAGILAQPVSGYIFDLLGGQQLFLLASLVVLAAIGLLLSRASRLRAFENHTIQ